MITLLFSTNDMIGSRIIRLATRSQWSHVDIALDDGTLIGALASSGVTRYPAPTRLNESTHYEFCTFSGDKERAIAYAVSQLDKAYD